MVLARLSCLSQMHRECRTELQQIQALARSKLSSFVFYEETIGWLLLSTCFQQNSQTYIRH
jgi:hypothetical protein